MRIEVDQDDFGVGLYENSVDLREPLEGEHVITCMGCGETFAGAHYDDCPECGAPADGA
jgi:rubrerythrin